MRGGGNGRRCAERGLVRIVAVGAAHDDPPPLPPIEPFAVGAAAHASTCAKVALGAQPVALSSVARSPFRSASSWTSSAAWQVEQRAPVCFGCTGWIFWCASAMRSSAMTTRLPRWHVVQGY